MDREQIRNKIFQIFKQQVEWSEKNPNQTQQFQISLHEWFQDIFTEHIPAWEQNKVFSVAREIIQEWINIGLIYPGKADSASDCFPWLTITEYGKQVIKEENWLPYDPEGYIKTLKERVLDIDDITIAYVGESISAYNRRQLLSATLTLGVASENLMLLLIEAYSKWIKDDIRREKLEAKIKDRFIYTQYKEFKQEFEKDIKNISKQLQGDWETYLEGVFNFIRLNRNSTGHPTGKELDAKVIYANLQIFADYSSYIFRLIKYFLDIK